MMRKLTFIIISSMILLCVNAEERSPRFVVKVGMALNEQYKALSVKNKITGDTYHYATINYGNGVGYMGGATVEFFAQDESFYFGPGLYYANKRVKYDGRDCDAGFIELPILVGVRKTFGKNNNFAWAAGGGWYFAYGVNGDAFDEAMKKFDTGVVINGRIEFMKTFIGLDFDLGVVPTEERSLCTIFVSLGRCF